ncbi:MAG: NAD(P)-dependent glycerol-3-phosphate dehydrogenase [Magnetococcales bacterium]|nr:NAD(P)-dependent glycerol-3-phosphate dehydrogenase [Magnetococcales bacterium]
MNNRTAVIGGGSWGTALARILAEKLPQVTLWCREPEVAEGINRTHRNPLFLSEFLLPSNLIASTDLVEVAAGHDILVMVVPTQFTRGVLQTIRDVTTSATLFVSASKGVEAESMTLLSEIYAQVLGQERGRGVCYLSGPSFARDALSCRPSAVAIAGEEMERVQRVQQLFHTSWFRTYSTDDVVGLELGGALKNVIALAAGISDGLGLGHSSRAALITRGLNEILRLGLRLGARAETFSGLSGLGDLLLTATSELSRNRTVGFRLGSGESLAEIQQGSREVAEGVKTAQGVYHLALKLDIDMPITRAVYGILYEGLAPLAAVKGLMERDLKPESGFLEGN